MDSGIIVNRARPTERIGRPKEYVAVVGMACLVKLYVFTYGFLAYQLWVNPGWPMNHTLNILRVWNQWDTDHYILIAQQGYSAIGEGRVALAFWPGYPLLLRWCWPFAHDFSPYLISGIASLVAAVELYQLSDYDYSSVWMFLIFPSAYFLHIGYTEAVFCSAVFATFLALDKGRWWLASATAAIASSTRLNGIFLLAPCAIRAVREYSHGHCVNWSWTILILLPPIAYSAYNYGLTGDSLAFLHEQYAHWNDRMVWPWDGMQISLAAARTYNTAQAINIGLFPLLFAILGLIAVLISTALFSLEWTAWIGINWLIIASQSWDLSSPRYLLPCFPIYVILGRLANRSNAWLAGLTTSSMLLFVLLSSQFIAGHGGW